MTNEELDKLLKSIREPERPADYWEQFPSSVVQALRREARPALDRGARWRVPRLAWGLGLATVCVAVGLLIGFRWGRHSTPELVPLAGLNNYLREIETLFPGQVQAIVFDESGPRLMLSEKADVPSSPPMFVRICEEKRCRSFITFSGQRVPMNGDEFEILVDAQGGVIVLGRQAVWSSTGTGSARLPYQIEAQRLEAAS